MSPYSYFGHTADIGVEVAADTLDGLFAEAGRALFNLIVNLDHLVPAGTESVELEAPDEVSLLVDWLNELIFLFDARGWLFCRFHVVVTRPKEGRGLQLTATCHGELAEGRQLEAGLKSAAYHEASVVQDGTWRTRFIIDV